MEFNLEQWIEEIKKGDKELLFYSGKITSEIVTEYMEKIESLSQELELPRAVEKRFVHVAVESIQNLFHHSCEKDAGNGVSKFATFLMSIKDNKLYLTTGNFIKQDTIRFLKNRIDQLNALSAEEIKNVYRMVLNGTKFSDKGGGGLGMIDIIKKTDSRIEYRIFNVSDELAFYEFKIKISELEK